MLNKKKNILSQVIVSKPELLPPLLDIINKKPNITQSDLRRASKYSGGNIYHCVKAMITLGLVVNGDGLRITNLGEQFLISFYDDKKIFLILLKDSYLRVPLFKKIYDEHINITNAKKLFKIFEEEIKNRYDNIDNKFLGSVVRRYLEGVHNIKLKSGFKMRNLEKKENPLTKELEMKREESIIDTIKDFKNNLNLSDNDIKNIIHSLPEKKKVELLFQLIPKVF